MGSEWRLRKRKGNDVKYEDGGYCWYFRSFHLLKSARFGVNRGGKKGKEKEVVAIRDGSGLDGRVLNTFVACGPQWDLAV